MHANTHGQVGGQVIHARMQRLAEFLDVATLLHRDSQANGRCTVETKHRCGGVDVTTPDVGDISQSIEPVVESQVDVGQVFFRLELPGRTHGNPLGPGVDDTGGRHGILRLQALHHLALIDAQGREFARGEVQVQHFILLAHHLDLAQARYVADLGAHLLHVVAQLAHRQAVAREGIHRTVHIAKFIVEPRSLQAFGKIAANVIDLLAHLVPDLRDFLGAGGIAQVHENR